MPDANYMVGGVMMGYLEEDHDALVDKTTGGVIVLPDEHVVVRRRRQDWQQIVRIGRSACDQCSFCTELCPRWLLGHPIEPHRAMRSLEFNLIGEANVIGTPFCCECNLCSLYSCPEDLDPKNVCTQNKRRLAAEKRRWENPPFNPQRPEMHLDEPQGADGAAVQQARPAAVPQRRSLARAVAAAAKVGIKLKQHVGAACEPVVGVGPARDQGASGGPAAGGQRQARPGRAGPRLDRRRRDGGGRRHRVDRAEGSTKQGIFGELRAKDAKEERMIGESTPVGNHCSPLPSATCGFAAWNPLSKSHSIVGSSRLCERSSTPHKVAREPLMATPEVHRRHRTIQHRHRLPASKTTCSRRPRSNC